MYSKFLFAALVALFAGMVWVGCDDENAPPHTVPPLAGSVQIVLGTVNDTLYFLPGDFASTSVTIIVSDYQARPLSGMKVDISLGDANLGVIEWADPDLQDTTNSAGRVNAVYRTYARAGTQIITTCAGGVCDNAIITILSSEPPICNLHFEGCDTLFVHPTFTDSCEFCFTIVDCMGHGISGLTPNVHATGGRLNLFPVTDAAGRSCSWGTPTAVGYYCLSIEMGGFSDSTCVTVLPDTTN